MQSVGEYGGIETPRLVVGDAADALSGSQRQRLFPTRLHINTEQAVAEGAGEQRTASFFGHGGHGIVLHPVAQRTASAVNGRNAALDQGYIAVALTVDKQRAQRLAVVTLQLAKRQEVEGVIE